MKDPSRQGFVSVRVGKHRHHPPLEDRERAERPKDQEHKPKNATIK